MIFRLPCLLVFAASSSSVITSDTSIKSAASRTVVRASTHTRKLTFVVMLQARAPAWAAFLTKIMIYVAPTLEISYLFCWIARLAGSIMSHKGLDPNFIYYLDVISFDCPRPMRQKFVDLVQPTQFWLHSHVLIIDASCLQIGFVNV